MKLNHLLVATAAAFSLQATAQVYRCGDAYSEKPCPGGTRVEVDDKRSAAQQAQTRQAAQRDAKTADAMEKARVKEEAKPVPVGMPPAKVASAPQEKKPAKLKKPGEFTAVAPGSKDAKKKSTKAKSTNSTPPTKAAKTGA